MQKIDEVKIEYCAVTGEGVGMAGAREVHLWDAFPGELIRPIIFARRKRALWGRSDEIISPNAHRIIKIETHFLSCSPWSGIDFEYEQELKREIIKKTFVNYELGDFELITDSKIAKYRNKMEYSFGIDERGELTLAFIERMGRKRMPLENCVLADENITRKASEVLELLKSQSVGNDELKALLIRSDRSGNVGFGLFVVNRERDWSFVCKDNSGVVYFSNPQSPMSIATEYLCGNVDLDLKENINGVEVRYGLLGFFQVNLPLFEKVILEMKHYVVGESIIDMFCGTGAISLALSPNIKNADLVDIDQNNINMALKNIENNNLQARFTAKCAPAEKTLEAITSDKILIIDPNRPGLHKDIIIKIREVRPKRIIYLSCNIETQARDLGLISDLYKPIHTSFYNFFPRTPHIESLFILDLTDM